MSKKKVIQKSTQDADPMLHHWGRYGHLTTRERVCLESIVEATHLLEKARRSCIYAIMENHHVPEDLDFVIMPDGDIAGTKKEER